MTNEGRRNAYHCRTCGRQTITINLCEGTTPFTIGCRAAWPGKCNGLATSAFFKIDQTTPPEYGWYRPTDAEAAQLDRRAPGTLAHVQKGGLILRRLDDAERETLAAPRPHVG